MNPFERAVAFVLAHEGGYSDDTHDSGGETKFGISKAAYPFVDIKNLTIEGAKTLYKADYWDKCSCGSFPQPISFVLFDCAVNQGPSKAVRLLQAVLKVPQDGKVGPQTIAAAQRADISYLTAMFVARRAYQYSLHPEIIRYGQGWFNRLAECHQMAMTEK